MIVCSVCENPQQTGFECDVCGKDLSGVLGLLGPPPVAIEPLAGLEVTVPERIGEIAVERTQDVEVNAFAPIGAVPAELIPDLEKTASDPVGEIPVLPIDELQDDRAPDD